MANDRIYLLHVPSNQYVMLAKWWGDEASFWCDCPEDRMYFGKFFMDAAYLLDHPRRRVNVGITYPVWEFVLHNEDTIPKDATRFPVPEKMKCRYSGPPRGLEWLKLYIKGLPALLRCKWRHWRSHGRRILPRA